MTYLTCPACNAKNGLRLARETGCSVFAVSPSLADLQAARQKVYKTIHPTCRNCGASICVILTRDGT